MVQDLIRNEIGYYWLKHKMIHAKGSPKSTILQSNRSNKNIKGIIVCKVAQLRLRDIETMILAIRE